MRFLLQVQLLLALDQIAADCGVRGVVTPAVWVERVDAVVPGGGGYWVKQYGLWQEVAPGVSLEQVKIERPGGFVAASHRWSGVTSEKLTSMRRYHAARLCRVPKP